MAEMSLAELIANQNAMRGQQNPASSQYADQMMAALQAMGVNPTMNQQTQQSSWLNPQQTQTVSFNGYTGAVPYGAGSSIDPEAKARGMLSESLRQQYGMRAPSSLTLAGKSAAEIQAIIAALQNGASAGTGVTASSPEAQILGGATGTASRVAPPTVGTRPDAGGSRVAPSMGSGLVQPRGVSPQSGASYLGPGSGSSRVAPISTGSGLVSGREYFSTPGSGAGSTSQGRYSPMPVNYGGFGGYSPFGSGAGQGNWSSNAGGMSSLVQLLNALQRQNPSAGAGSYQRKPFLGVSGGRSNSNLYPGYL